VVPTKVEGIMEWPMSKNVLKVLSFMGLAVYY
jgi:hypothetical protein